MITEIGIVSGKILDLLEDNTCPVSIEEIEFYFDEPIEIILMSIGWLAREGYIHIEERDEEFYVSEKKNRPLKSRLSEFSDN